MTKKDRTNLSILIVLLVVLGLTITLVYRMNQPPTTAAVQTPPPKTAPPNPTSPDAKIRLDLVEKPDSASDEVGRKNVFQYQQTRPALPSQKSGPAGPIVSSPPVNVTPPVQTVVRPPAPTGPPPPPPILYKYQGFLAVSSPGGSMTAILADDSRHYLVTVGEVLMGRYRISKITNTAVEVEDLEYNRRQTLPLVK